MGSREDDDYWNVKYDTEEECKGCGALLEDEADGLEYCFWCADDEENDCND